MGYDGAGNQTALQAPNGTLQTWGYDAAGRPITTTDTLAGTILFSQTDTLDAAGQRIAIDDSWGHSAFGYDPAGRLVGASYPDGSTELDQYDGVGNRTVITSTVTLSGTSSISTTIASNSYDAADELTGSTAQTVGVQGPPQPTTYAYDANGNQLGSVGPSGAMTNTYDLRNELVGVVGPSTNVTYVYDGQGDRLRAYDTAGLYPVLHNYAQDLAAGMSDLLSDGQQDYAYLQPGSGQAPVSALNQATQRSAYLGPDLLGSVRLVTDPTGAAIGAGAFDAWGNARPNTSGTSGATLLAGLTGTQPFGFAGQYLDAGAGTYDMRAREYSPQQGQFESVDPLLSQTNEPYLYAGDSPAGRTDPSGMAWVDYTAQSMGDQDLLKAAIEDEFIARDAAGATAVNVNVSVPPGVSGIPGLGHADMVSMGALTRGGVPYGDMYDIVPDMPSTIEDPTFSAQRDAMNILAVNACEHGFAWQANGTFHSPDHVDLEYGRYYPLPTSVFESPGARAYAAVKQLWVPTPTDVYLTYAWLREPGIISYRVCREQRGAGVPCAEPEPHQTTLCPLGSVLACALDFVVFGGIGDCSTGDYGCQGLALVKTLAVALPFARGAMGAGAGTNLYASAPLVDAVGPQGVIDAIQGETQVILSSDEGGNQLLGTVQDDELKAVLNYPSEDTAALEAEQAVEDAVVETDFGPATKGAVKDANYAQNKIRSDELFSPKGQEELSKNLGIPIRTVNDLVVALEHGVVKPSQLPIDFVDMNDTRLILNTRTSTALQRAGVSKSEWFGRDRTLDHIENPDTGEEIPFTELATDQLIRNGGWPSGFATLNT